MKLFLAVIVITANQIVVILETVQYFVQSRLSHGFAKYIFVCQMFIVATHL